MFFLHASTFGFFLEFNTIRNGPTPGLLRCVYLIGAHLCGVLYPSPDATAYQERESRFLRAALQETAIGLSEAHPQRFLHTLQAETLLSHYFFRCGQILEAKRHASSAASLALDCGFHKLRSSFWQWDASAIGLEPNHSTPLEMPKNSVEEGERINAFWTVFTLHRNLAAASAGSSVSGLCGVFDAIGMEVHTPWPLEMNSYKQVSRCPLYEGAKLVNDGPR